jgi:hypothetical protein
LSRWDWLLFSVILSTLGGLLHWLIQHLAGLTPRRHTSLGLWTKILRIIESPWLRQPLRVLYAVGIPLAALIWQGSLTTRGLGLKPLPFGSTASTSASSPWIDDIGWFAILTTVTITVVLIGDGAARHQGAGTPPARKARDLPNAAIDAVVRQVHWAFYREPFVINWDIALGSWLGAGAVLAETILDLMFWERLGAKVNGHAYKRQMLIRGGLLAASSHLHLRTQNLWLAILMDLVVGWLLMPGRPTPARAIPISTRETSVNSTQASVGHKSGDDDDAVGVDAVGIA